MKKNIFNMRYIFFILMILFVGPLIYIASNTGIIGRIIALIFLFFISSIAIFEAIWNCVKKQISYIICALLSLIIIIAVNYEFMGQAITNNTNNTINQLLVKFFYWWSFIIPLFIITPFLLIVKKESISNIFFTILIVLIFTLFFGLIFLLAIKHWTYIVFVLGITVIYDSLAYLFGLLIGGKVIHRKLMPKISPKKSWEGFILGCLFASIFAGVFGWYFQIFSSTNFPKLCLIFSSILLPIICQFGDLFFSAIKRSNNLKDFSNLIPGHGGIIDRIDGLVFVTITFILFFELGVII